ncbi:Smr/MutS family protein [Candidatus Kinetoplastidibacterium crithidiae]|uniref:SMR/MUTS family protein n=1 Tax=Candidatus Kinetoplastidibacterium crithidiae TCC036E TaxID=1208918 RepID=M1LUM7_9PROT|nr:Smr/MutS family protein [Candidatus Kinetoplastibacterium crithidii]AFZ82537.1 Smr domain-containing protein [Candidatus Kinetoplastibacterium crithidii (ex Angomonas deanei ATCC 30255)]AGF47801.1 SMR/MUTS family protein [Candidatus Kinetoplastibacterium crithidii TCC036E]
MGRIKLLKIEDFKRKYLTENKNSDKHYVTKIKTNRFNSTIKKNSSNYDIIKCDISDELEMSHVLSDDGKSFIRNNSDPNIAKNLKNGKWPIKAILDLHGLKVDSAREILNKFIQECYQKNMRCIKIIHGKGYGSNSNIGPILKQKMPSWLVQIEKVQAFSEASKHEGGTGAVVILIQQRIRS